MKDVLDKIDNFLIEGRFDQTLQDRQFEGKKYKAGSPVKFSQLTPGDIVYYTYRNGGRVNSEVFKFEGFSNMEEKYGDSGVKFRTWKDLANHYKVSNLAAAKALSDEKEYGYGFYMCGDFGGGDKGCYFYIYKGGWVRGSGADKISMTRAVEV